MNQMELYQLPPGKTVYNAIQEFVNKFTGWESKSCNPPHTHCINLKKFLKYIFDNNIDENDLYLCSIKKLCERLISYFNNELCFTLNENYNTEIIKQHLLSLQKLNDFDMGYLNCKEHIKVIVKESLCSSFNWTNPENMEDNINKMEEGGLGIFLIFNLIKNYQFFYDKKHLKNIMKFNI
jgi:hypothetical protein